MKKSFLLAVIMMLGAAASADVAQVHQITPLESLQAEQLIGDRQVIFLAHELESNQQFAYALSRIEQRHRPFSTFKIPNLLIALETGVEQSLDSSREWNPGLRPEGDFWPRDWAQAQTLQTAFRRSAVWYFRDIALEVGGPAYRHWLEGYNYGNALVPDDNDLFWLQGPLEISIREQVEFITRLIRDELPVSDASRYQLIEVSRLDEREGHVLHGKTGSGPVGDDFDGPFEGWLVGWVDRPDQGPVAFALFVEGPDFSSIRTFRTEMSLYLLKQAGFWPE